MPKTSLFTYEELKEFMQLFEESNSKVAREYLGREDGVLFRAPLPNLPLYKVNEETMSRDVLAYAASMFCAQEKKIRQMREEMDNLKKQMEKINNNLFVRTYRKVKHIIKK